MSHFGKNSNGIKQTPKEWLPIGKAIGELANTWSGRSDLVAYVGTKLDAPVPALYNPTSSEIEVNNEIAFGNLPVSLISDLSQRDNHYDFPKAIGAIYHEACHAKYSRWSLEQSSKDLTPKQNEALHLLEESRIESFGAKEIPTNRYFLSSCALEIVLGEFDVDNFSKTSQTRAMAHLAGLVLARVDAGILFRSDVAVIAEMLETKLGIDFIEKLRELWLKAQAHYDHYNATNLYSLAIEWDRLVSERAKEKGEDDTFGCFPVPNDETGEGESGTGESETESGKGESNKGNEKSIEEMLDEVRKAKEKAESRANENLIDQQIGEHDKKVSKARADSNKETETNRKSSQRVFGEPETSVRNGGSRSSLVETRKPTSAERASAVLISKLLMKAKYRNRTETKIKSVLPQGRLRSRAVVQREALRSKGILTQVETWTHKTRKHTETPNLSIGIMVDVSGSMGSAMKPMGSTAWILSEAGRRVQAKTAMVYFGDGVFPTLKVGQHLEEVNVYSAPDGTEKFDLGFQALDGNLGLLSGNSARLLVVVSDACYTDTEIKATKHWLQRCKQAGVGVLWITYDAGIYANAVIEGSDTQLVKVKGAITEVAEIIGKAGAEALTKAGQRLGR
jgi:hypothetical protein